MKLSNTVKENVIGKEMPWLLPLLPEWAESFRVEVIDTDLLVMKPRGHQGAYGWTKFADIYFVNSKGEKVGEVGECTIQDGVRAHYEWSWRRPFLRRVEIPFMRKVPETVEQALKRLDPLADDVRYIVVIDKEIVLHRLPKPKNVRFKDWLQSKLDEEASILSKQLAKLDEKS